jgi:uncharacterized protein YdbL (DUF1318 family)
MTLRSIYSFAAIAGLALLGAAVAVVPAAAQDYASAKAAGLIGERVDGYVAVVGAGNADLRRVADDTNIKRKAVYAEKAQLQRVTVEEYAFATACTLIAKTATGEKYQAPDGTWRTRTLEAPVRDARCP